MARIMGKSSPPARRPPNEVSARRRASVGLWVLFTHLALSPLIFCRYALEAFDDSKLALLLITSLALTAFRISRWLSRIPTGRTRWHVGGWDPILAAVALVLLAAVVSTVASIDPLTSVLGQPEHPTGLVTLLAYAVILLLTRSYCRTLTDARFLLAAPVLAGAMTSLYALAQAAHLDPFVWRNTSDFGSYVRPFGTLGHPNQLAAYLVLALPITVLFARESAQRCHWRRFGILVAIVGIDSLAVLFSLSRGAWLAMIVMAVMLAFAWQPFRRKAAWKIALVLVAPLGTGLMVGGENCAFGNIRSRLAQLADSPARREVWAGAIAIFREHPFFGSGLDTFQLAFEPKRSVAYWGAEWNGSPTHAHNEFLNLLATQGLFGTICELAAVVLLLRALWTSWNTRTAAEKDMGLAIGTGLVGFLVTGLFSFTVVGTGTLVVTLVAILLRENDLPATTTDSISTRASIVRSPWIRVLRGGIAVSAVMLGYVAVVRPFEASVWCAAGEDGVEENSAEAIADYRRTIEAMPCRAHYWVKLGLAARRAGEMAADPASCRSHLCTALDAFQQAHQLMPARAVHRVYMGGVLALLARDGDARPDDAFAEFDRALAAEPLNHRFYQDAAEAGIMTGNWKRAENYAERLIEANPHFGAGYAALGSAAYRQGQFERALNLLQESVAKQWYNDDDSLLMAKTVLAAAYLARGKFEDAAGAARSVLDLKPSWPAPRMTLAKSLELLGHRDEALAEYRAILDCDPQFRPAQQAFEHLRDCGP